MKDFTFRNDTKLYFLNDIRETLAGIVKGQKVMLVYGGGSIKRNGCYGDIIDATERAGAQLVEYGDASREFEKIQNGIKLAKAEGVTMVIGVGGASCMDCSKLISFGYYHEEDLWDYVKGKPSYGLRKLPTVAIPTYPSSGSENGLGAVSIDSRTGDFGTAYGIPAEYAILCPKYSLTLGKEMTAYTGLVTLVQLCACILGDKNPISYDAGISYIKNVLKATETLKDEPQNIDARSTIMLGASISTSSRLGIGKEDFFAYDIYEIEFLPEKLFGSTYRRSLTSIFPRFLKAMAKHHEADVRKLYSDAFGFNGSVEESTNQLISLFESLGVPMYYEGNATREQVDNIPRRTELSNEEIYSIIADLKE